MAKKKKEQIDAQILENSLIRVKPKTGDDLIVLPNRMIFVEDGYAIVTPEEYEQLKEMGVV